VNEDQCSELFWETFDSGCGGCVRVCECGITHFDTFNVYDWEQGELEKYLEKAKEDPEKYREHDCSIGTIEIAGYQIVYGCSCDLAKKFEDFIISHAVQIAKYLNERAKLLKHKAEMIEVKGV